MPTPQANVGDRVHYVSWGTPIRDDGTQAYTSQCRSATVTEVGGWVTEEAQALPTAEDGTPRRAIRQRWVPDAAGLVVHNPTGLFFHPAATGGCPHDPGSGSATWSCDGRDHQGGTWHTPVRAEDL